MVEASPKGDAAAPSPPYLSSSSSDSPYGQHPQQPTSGSLAVSPFPSMFTPPVVQNSHHTPSTYQMGPTPPQQLHLPYAYYDPHSAYSVSLADSRAKKRFIGALLYAVAIWLLVVALVRWWGSGWTVHRLA